MPLLGLFMSLTSWSMPAKPGKVTLLQPDGTKVEVYIHGDEWFHYYESLDGKVLIPGSDGLLKYAEFDASGNVVAGSVNVAGGNATHRATVATHGTDVAAMRSALGRQAEQARACSPFRANRPGAIKTMFPTKGTMRGLIVLAQYQDVKFSPNGTLEKFQQMASADDYKGENAPGSMRDYFITQSHGQFTPEFDVVGPVTLPKNRAYYGSASEGGSERVIDMIRDAATLAHDECGVDFSRYDANNDDAVDFFYVIFAGYGQAQGGPEECVWPCAMDLSNDTSIPEFDDKYLGRIACSSELKGYERDTIDGIGTFCHEFSHILGLPDIYDVNYTSCYGMNHNDIMDRGGYNNNGFTPAGYTAMDKYTVGWLEPTVLSEAADRLELEDLTESNKAYFIVSDKDQNEYYTLENRQPTKWDAALPGHGLLISHIKYSSIHWNKNLVNTVQAGFEHVQLIPADGLWDDKSADNPNAEANDYFPGVDGHFTEFSSATRPALTWRTGESAEGQGIYNISLANGVVTFDYRPSTATGISGITDNADSADSAWYTIRGERVNGTGLPKGIYVHGGKKVVVR